MAATVLAAAQALPQRGLAENQAKVFWSKEMLHAKPNEAAIRQNTRAAFVPIPDYKPEKLSPLPKHLRGVIRRVVLPPSDKRIALTFDLCEQPHEIAGYQGDVVDYLRSQNIPATFFAGGKWPPTHRRRATQLMADQRFQIANHSWEHRNHRLINGTVLAAAIDGAQAACQLNQNSLKASACISSGSQNRTKKIQLTDTCHPCGRCSDFHLEPATKHLSTRSMTVACSPSNGMCPLLIAGAE